MDKFGGFQRAPSWLRGDHHRAIKPAPHKSCPKCGSSLAGRKTQTKRGPHFLTHIFKCPCGKKTTIKQAVA